MSLVPKILITSYPVQYKYIIYREIINTYVCMDLHTLVLLHYIKNLVAIPQLQRASALGQVSSLKEMERIQQNIAAQFMSTKCDHASLKIMLLQKSRCFYTKQKLCKETVKIFLVLKCLVLINNANFELQLLECLSSIL